MSLRMALSDLLDEEEKLIDRENITIGDLIDIFGREPTRRGLEYMQSLEKAEREFKQSVDADTMTKGYRDAGVEGDVEPVSRKWKAESEKKGLGLNDESQDSR